MRRVWVRVWVDMLVLVVRRRVRRRGSVLRMGAIVMLLGVKWTAIDIVLLLAKLLELYRAADLRALGLLGVLRVQVLLVVGVLGVLWVGC